MGEVGCLKDGHFQNLQVDGLATLVSSTSTAPGSLLQSSATSATIAVAKETDYAVPAIAQPAGTLLRDLVFLNAGNIVTDATEGDDFEFEVGTTASGGEIITLKDLLAPAGAGVTWTANTPLKIITNATPAAVNAHAPSPTTGAPKTGGPATSEAVALAGPLYAASAREIHVNFITQANNLTTADTTIKVIATFQYL